MKRQLEPSNSVVPCPAVLVSVRGPDRPNIITLAWAANVCSEPPTVVVGIRPRRYSHGLVKEAGDFVVNIPSADLLEATKLCGTKSGRDMDKFAVSHLTAEPSTKVTSPMIKECPINIECKTKQVITLGSHDLFIAEVVAVHIDESVLDEKGNFDAAKAKLFAFLPLTGDYWALGEALRESPPAGSATTKRRGRR
ncbi:MAG: flavin reductase family protein [Candidatus Thorarchaeota archaeon]|nr:MAG: flavin reductase family protein [Candidatus Thorarchaeota archaeon]